MEKRKEQKRKRKEKLKRKGEDKKEKEKVSGRLKKRNNEVLRSVWERDRPGSTTPGGESSTLNATGTGFE